MKKLILFVLAAILLGLLIYRFTEKRKVDTTRTIALIQAEQGYPVEVRNVTVGPFSMTRSYTGTIVGGKQSVVVSSLSEHISRVLVAEGQYVEKDQVICELSNDNPAVSHAQVKLALENAERELARTQKLFDEGAVSQQILDGVKLQRDLSAEALETSEQLLYLRSPIDGIITELVAEMGKLVTPGEVVAKVVSTEKARVEVQIPARDRELVKIGAVCIISMDGVSKSGRVRRISLSADTESRSFTSWITFNERSNGHLFSPGLLVDVSIHILDVEEALIVHPDALFREGENWYIYTIKDDTARQQKIDLGGRNVNAAWIRSGLEPDAKVVIGGGKLLFDGAPVRIVTRN